MTKARTKYINARMLTRRPHLPREKYWPRDGCLPQILNQAIEPIEIMYEARSATVPKAVSWLKAIVEPKLIEMRRMEMTVVAKMALTGMS